MYVKNFIYHSMYTYIYTQVLDELEKRAMMGFQGMRGKKSEPTGAAAAASEWNKRAPMGFQGMRGRKSSFLDDLDELEKRALLGFHVRILFIAIRAQPELLLYSLLLALTLLLLQYI